MLGSLRGNIVVPLTAVEAVERTNTPVSDVRGFRSPGTSIPGRIRVGIFRSKGHKLYAAAYRNRPGYRIFLTDQNFDSLIISSPEVEGLEQLRLDT